LTRPGPAWSTEPVGPDAWKLDGLCAQIDPELWFPEKGERTRLAQRLCGQCSVQATCLEYALTNDERHGVWGGKSERQRQKMLGARSSAPRDSHPDAANREPRVQCDCGLSKCQGVVAASTRKGHRREVRELSAAPLAA
jgi:WhiB family redox-sensing transcriptional regulator